MKSLDEILNEYFGCKNPFLSKPRVINSDGDKEYFTKAGGRAYNKLTCLIEDLSTIVEIEDVSGIIDQLDEIVRSEE